MALRSALIALAAPVALLVLVPALAFLLGPPAAPGRPGGSGSGSGSAVSAPPPVVVGAPGERRHRRGDGGAALGALHLHLTPALARAYAAAGALLDGRRHDLAGLDAAARAELGRAEELLAYAVPLAGARQATRLADGATMQLGAAAGAATSAAPATAGAATAGPAGPAATTGASVRHDAGAALPAPAPPAAGAGSASALPDAAVASHLDGSARAPIPISGDTTKLLTLPGAWLAIPYQPGLVQGQPLVIENQSGGEYAISLVGGDFGAVRLDGGLVVPGRYYRINGTATVTATLPVGVHIRPLSAVGTYYEQPLLMPGADG